MASEDYNKILGDIQESPAFWLGVFVSNYTRLVDRGGVAKDSNEIAAIAFMIEQSETTNEDLIKLAKKIREYQNS